MRNAEVETGATPGALFLRFKYAQGGIEPIDTIP
jgi:hypothetical protein